MQMNAIRILNDCRSAPEEIRRTEQRIWQRQRFVAGRRTDRPGNAEQLREEIERLQEELTRQQQRSAVLTAAACALLDRLPGTESAVLYGYYIEGQSVAGLARKLSYSEGYVRKLRKQGEDRLRRIPGSEAARQLPAWYIREVEGDG